METHRTGDPHPGTPRPASRVAAAWHDDRAYLLATAARILGDADGAEDVVAEAFSRLAAQPDTPHDTRGWLVVVVRRIALDRLRSAHHRLSVPADPAGPELGRRPALDSGSSDPADRITLDDEIRHALAVVLDRLGAGERAAFLLHDVFGLPFADVGVLLGRTASACRQLASRARRSIRAGGARVTVRGPAADPRLDHVAERFVAACAEGDIAGLATLLHDDVTGWAVLDDVVLNEVAGARRVSRGTLAFFGHRSPWSLVPFPLDDCPAVLVTRDGAPRGVIRLVCDETGLVTALRATLLPRPRGGRPAGNSPP